MTETYEQALARFTENFRRGFGDKASTEMSPDVRYALERAARWALEIPPLPVLPFDARGRVRCPQCKRFLSRNYATRDDEGYASLNCEVHGWVGKWKD